LISASRVARITGVSHQSPAEELKNKINKIKQAMWWNKVYANSNIFYNCGSRFFLLYETNLISLVTNEWTTDYEPRLPEQFFTLDSDQLTTQLDPFCVQGGQPSNV
jgi:hypothetical protein